MISSKALTRRLPGLLIGAALLAGVLGTALAQSAQPYPSKVVTFKSAMAAGSTTDVMAREIGQLLSERMGQPVIVDPLAGSGGLLAAQKVINSPPDGYTLLFVSNGLISNQAMRAKPQTDLSKDLIAISPLLEGYFGLYVNANLPARTMQEFVAYAKANPGKVNYGSSGIGGIVHLVTEDFRMREGLDLVHVPYKGTAELMPAILSNQIQLTFADTTFMQPHIDSGKLRLLGVSSKKRLAQLPNAPTFEELGLKGFTPTFWYGLYAPRGTPAPIIERVNSELKAILTPQEAQQRYAARGYQTVWMTSADTQRKVQEELSQMNRTIDQIKIERQ